ncbi:transposase, partial [Microbulbifer thermotolerans]|nr:transposase [Microbulbifer thermotolerans]
SQALLDERALAACMAYVDLNPIRAKMTEMPENSEHTSVQRRISAAQGGNQPQAFQLQDYLELVDWSGRCLREDKRGAINEQLPPILDRMQINPRHWLYLNRNFESRFKSLV